MQLGAYQIEHELGRGGFGVVYVGIDQRLGRRAAIKQLLPELSTQRDIVERFFNEAKAAASIVHPGIVEIYDVGWDADGSAYFAMKLLDGESLGRRLRAGPLSIAHAATIARQVASALAAAHERGIVHRDLKPDNIILVPDDEISIGERAVIVDFGIAKLGNTSGMTQTRTGVMMGTPGYMSPEQCRGAGEVDHRTDLYALGCIVFEMLTGRMPFVGVGPGEVMGMHQFVEPPLLRSLRPDAPAELEALVGKLLAKKLDQRMQQMTELGAALGDFATGGRVHVPAPSASAALPASLVSSNARTAMSERDVAVVPPEAFAPTVRPDISAAAAAANHPPKTTLGVARGEVSRVEPAPTRSRKTLVIAIGAAMIIALVVVIVAVSRSDDRPSQVATIPADSSTPGIDAPIDTATEADRQRRMRECDAIAGSRNWSKLEDCAHELDKGDDDHTGARYAALARKESRAEAKHREVADALARLELARARIALAAIPDDSVYHADAQKAFDAAKGRLIDREVVAITAIKKNCQRWKRRLQEIETEYGKDVAVQVAGETTPCGTIARGQVFDTQRGNNPKPGSGAVIPPLPPVGSGSGSAASPKTELTREDISRTLTALNSAVRECYLKFRVPGTVTASLRVNASGVQGAMVIDTFAGTETGVCVEMVARGAKFPPFQGSTTIKWSWKLVP